MASEWIGQRASKFLLFIVACGLLAACGGGGGSSGSDANQLADVTKYSGVTTRADITTANAVALSAESYTAGSIGQSADVLGKMVPREAIDGRTTLPELAALVRDAAAKATAKRTAASSQPGVATVTTINGAAAGSCNISMNVIESTGEFSGTLTFNSYQDLPGGPTVSGVVTVSGGVDAVNGNFSTITMNFSPLSATTAKGSTELYGSFTFASSGTVQTLRMSCTLRINAGNTYWIKDWTYTHSGNIMTITGVYYHPQYGYVEVTTPVPLTVAALSATPTAGVFQAAGAHCTKARLTFSPTGSVVTAYVEGSADWVTCTE